MTDIPLVFKFLRGVCELMASLFMALAKGLSCDQTGGSLGCAQGVTLFRALPGTRLPPFRWELMV